MRSAGPQFHAIASEYVIDPNALFDTPEVRWHES